MEEHEHLVEVVSEAVLAYSTNSDGSVTLSTERIAEGLVATLAWFMAMNPHMADRRTRKLFCADVSKALSSQIVSARQAHSEGGMDALLAGASIQ